MKWAKDKKFWRYTNCPFLTAVVLYGDTTSERQTNVLSTDVQKVARKQPNVDMRAA
jgi:hypothetical protein